MMIVINFHNLSLLKIKIQIIFDYKQKVKEMYKFYSNSSLTTDIMLDWREKVYMA